MTKKRDNSAIKGWADTTSQINNLADMPRDSLVTLCVARGITVKSTDTAGDLVNKLMG